MAHPNFLRLRELADFFGPIDLVKPVLALLRALDLAAQFVGDQLHAVANTKDRRDLHKLLHIPKGRLRLVHRIGATAKNYGHGFTLFDFFQGSIEQHELGKDTKFAASARDQLSVLGPEIQNDDA